LGRLFRSHALHRGLFSRLPGPARTLCGAIYDPAGGSDKVG